MRKFLSGLVALVALVGNVAAADQDKFLPADTEQVMVINVKQILTSALFKKYALEEVEKGLKDNKEYKQFQELSGMDVMKDVNSVVFANSGTTGEKAMLIVRGKFDLDKIAKTAGDFADKNATKLKISKVGDRTLYEMTDNGKNFFATFIDGTTMVGSPSKDFVKAAADGKAGKINKDLASALEAVDGKQSIWMAGLIPEEALQQLGGLQQGPGEALKKVKAATGGLTFTDSVSATLSLSTSDPKAAKELGDFANQMKGLLALFAMGNEQAKPFVDELLKTLMIKTNRGDVSVSFKLSEDIIKKAVEMIPKP